MNDDMEVNKKKKGFTLIELIVVMAVLAVLVLLAAPKFLGQTKEATFTKHVNNAKVMADASERYYIDHGKWPRGADEDVYTPEEVNAYAERIYDITGEELVLEEGKYWDIDYSALEKYAKLPDEDERVNYVLRNPVGKVFYLEGLTEEGEARLSLGEGGEPETSEAPAEKPIPDYYVLATDADFSGTSDGGFQYIGTDEYVLIPDEIKGVSVTSYSTMFANTGVKGVASTNPNVTNMRRMFFGNITTYLELTNLLTSNVTDMSGMFYNVSASALDLSNFDTSKVTNMRGMFQNSKATTLELTNFDTSNVTDMGVMFWGSEAMILDLSSFETSKVTTMTFMFHQSKATAIDVYSFDTSNVTNMAGMFMEANLVALDLSNFNTSNVIDMRDMFRRTQFKVLDLSTFDISKVTDMRWMFENAVAQTGYARTQTDANKLNTSSSKPDSLVFTVKP